MAAGKNRDVAFDCRYFIGDRPCIWHKREQAMCKCTHYDPVTNSTLIIKLDAMGDVLRTTSLLPAMAAAWPQSRISWVTGKASVGLLQNNPYLTHVVSYGADAIAHIESQSFTRVINLDAARASAELATMARSNDKTGYLIHDKGYVTPTNDAAAEWLRLGVYDDLKKANQRTYQDFMCSIVGLPTDSLEYVLQLEQKELEQGIEHLRRLGIDPAKPVIGLHTGGGGRWQFKQWGEQQFMTLIGRIKKTFGEQTQVLLMGGPDERERNARMQQALTTNVFDSGCDNAVRHFAALVAACNLMVSGDTLAMHVALAMNTRCVTLFGPTSSAEIELFGRGEKVIPELDCLCCYKMSCDFVPNCMEKISVDMVEQAMRRQWVA